MDDDLGKRFERFAGGDDLSQDIHAIAIGVDHLLNRLKLTDDFSQPNFKRSSFLYAVNVLGRLGHSRSLDRLNAFENVILANKGYGGILLM